MDKQNALTIIQWTCSEYDNGKHRCTYCHKNVNPNTFIPSRHKDDCPIRTVSGT